MAKPFQRLLFWFLLFAPAVLALASFAVGQSSWGSKDLGVGIGFTALLFDVMASIYCGYWLAKRFCRTTPARWLTGIGMAIGIAILNFIIICAGCAGNVVIH